MATAPTPGRTGPDPADAAVKVTVDDRTVVVHFSDLTIRQRGLAMEQLRRRGLAEDEVALMAALTCQLASKQGVDLDLDELLDLPIVDLQTMFGLGDDDGSEDASPEA